MGDGGSADWAKGVGSVTVRSITAQKLDGESKFCRNKHWKVVERDSVATDTNSARHFDNIFTNGELFCVLYL